MFAHATETTPIHAVDHLALFFSRLAAAFGGAMEANRVYNRYSRLSDRELARRGLDREDVNRMTLQALSNAVSR